MMSYIYAPRILRDKCRVIRKTFVSFSTATLRDSAIIVKPAAQIAWTADIFKQQEAYARGGVLAHVQQALRVVQHVKPTLRWILPCVAARKAGLSRSRHTDC